MEYSAAEITALIGSFLWPFFRISAMLTAAPVTGAQSVPVRVRLGLAVAITAVIVPVLPPVPALDAFSLPSLMIIAQQILIGATMGLVMQFVFGAVIAGSQIVATQMGLGFSSMVDPANGQQVATLGQFYVMVTTLLFLEMNGHLLLIELLVESFRTLPIAAEGLDRDAFHALASWGTHLFADAVWLSLPAVGSLLVVNVAMGVMTRAAPQLNIFSVGFAVTLIVGFVVVSVTLESVIPQFASMADDGFKLVRFLIREAN